MITVQLPRILQPAAGDRLKFTIEAETLGQALSTIFTELPELKPHILDEDGILRPHVLCFVDGESNRLNELSQTVDRDIRFHPAISGG